MIKKITTLLRPLSLFHPYLEQYSSQAQPTTPPLPIQTMSQLLQQRKANQIINLDSIDQSPSTVFITLLKALKANMYQNPEQEAKILRILNRYKGDMEYVKLFVYLVLPVDQLFPQLNQIYIQVAHKFLLESQQLHKQQLYYILQNLERIITELKSTWTDEHWVLRDYTPEQQITALLVPKLIAMSHEFNISVILKLTRICNSLGVYSAELGAFLLDNIDLPSCRVKMSEIIMVLAYLSNLDCFPYEYFYRNSGKWVRAIESYNKFSSKKSIESIRMLQILTTENPMFCQKMIRRVQDVLLEAMPSLDPEQLANLWHIANKSKFGIYGELKDKMIEKIGSCVDGMALRELCLLVRGFENFRELTTQRYRESSIAILKIVGSKLDSTRVYQHEVIRLLMAKLETSKQATK